AKHQSRALCLQLKAAPGWNLRIERVRTASSVVCLAVSRQRINRSSENLASQRIVFDGSGLSGANASRFERRTVSQHVCSTWVRVYPGPAPLFRAAGGQKLAAMRPKEFSCRKNWLSPRPPTNEGSRFSKKVS